MELANSSGSSTINCHPNQEGEIRSVVVDIFLVVSLKIQIFCLTVGSSSLIFLFMVFKQQGRIWGLNSCRGGVVERKACWGGLIGICRMSTRGRFFSTHCCRPQSISEVLLQCLFFYFFIFYNVRFDQ